MAVSDIIATPSHPQANSYITVEEASQYFEDRYEASDWNAASTNQKKQILIESTRLIDSYRFHYDKLQTWQALEFPRTKHDRISGQVQSSTVSTVHDDDLKDKIAYPDDFWNYGAIWFTNEGDANYMGFYDVTDFVASTGTITIDGTFAETLQDTEQFQLIREIPPEIKWATCETALAIAAGTLLTLPTSSIKRQKLDTEEVEYFDRTSQTVSLPGKAEQLLRPYISNTGRMINTRKFR